MPHEESRLGKSARILTDSVDNNPVRIERDPHCKGKHHRFVRDIKKKGKTGKNSEMNIFKRIFKSDDPPEIKLYDKDWKYDPQYAWLKGSKVGEAYLAAQDQKRGNVHQGGGQFEQSPGGNPFAGTGSQQNPWQNPHQNNAVGSASRHQPRQAAQPRAPSQTGRNGPSAHGAHQMGAGGGRGGGRGQGPPSSTNTFGGGRRDMNPRELNAAMQPGGQTHAGQHLRNHEESEHGMPSPRTEPSNYAGPPVPPTGEGDARHPRKNTNRGPRDERWISARSSRPMHGRVDLSTHYASRSHYPGRPPEAGSTVAGPTHSRHGNALGSGPTPASDTGVPFHEESLLGVSQPSWATDRPNPRGINEARDAASHLRHTERASRASHVEESRSAPNLEQNISRSSSRARSSAAETEVSRPTGRPRGSSVAPPSISGETDAGQAPRSVATERNNPPTVFNPRATSTRLSASGAHSNDAMAVPSISGETDAGQAPRSAATERRSASRVFNPRAPSTITSTQGRYSSNAIPAPSTSGQTNAGQTPRDTGSTGTERSSATGVFNPRAHSTRLSGQSSRLSNDQMGAPSVGGQTNAGEHLRGQGHSTDASAMVSGGSRRHRRSERESSASNQTNARQRLRNGAADTRLSTVLERTGEASSRRARSDR